MKYQQTESLGDVLKRYIEALKIKSKLQETRLISEWENILGPTIAKATTNIYIVDKKMFVHINSSVIRSELLMHKTELLKRLNGGEEIIKDIIFR